MKIKTLQWRNIGSFGNKIQTLNFSDNGELWQLYGRVGHGKSTILSLPILAFYGKTKDIKVGDIANRINKSGWIKIEVENRGDNYIIERTFSPSGLSISKNGKNIDRARDMQSIIDNEIVGLPYNIFTNILSLSLNNFKSFINMNPNDKRQIIDKIFSLEIINKIYEFIKKDLRDLGASVNTLDMQIFSFEQTIKQSKDEIDKLKNNLKMSSDEDIKKYQNIIAQIDDMILKNKNSYDEHLKMIEDNNKKIEALNNTINVLKNDIKNINDKLKLFNNSRCPICGNDFNTDEFNDIKVQLNNSLKEKQTQYNTYLDGLNKLNEYIKRIKDNINTLNNNNTQLQINRNNALNQIKLLQSNISNDKQYEAINNIIINAEKSKKNIELDKIKYTNKINNLQILECIYNAEGIKKHIMDNYIPTLNSEIKQALINLSFPYSLEFDNNFNAHLEYLGSEIPVSSLSTGETKKVDLAVLISMIKVIKRKYPQINLICLDETVSSIDQESCLDIIKLLKDIANELSLNMLIVSHVQLPVEYFSKRIEVFKHLSFSDIKYIEN